MKTTLISLCLLLSLSRCTDQASIGRAATGTAPSDPVQVTTPANNSKNVLNNIVAAEKGGLKVAAAYLVDETGNLINHKNTVALGTPVYLTIQIKDGWAVQNGFVSPGAVQIITTDNGEPVLQSSDLFAGAKRIRAADASKLQLKTLITATRPDIAFYVVRFRIWDKEGTGAVEGYYHLRVKN